MTRARATGVGVLIVLAACGASRAGPAENRLRNPSFENESARQRGMPEVWSWGRIRFQWPAAFTWTNHARSGKRAARIESVFVTQYLMQRVPVKEAGPFVFGVFLRGHGSATLSVQFRDGADHVVGKGPATTFTLTDRWLRYEVFGRLPAGAASARCHITTPTTGCRIDADDAYFREGPEPPRPEPTGARLREPAVDVVPISDVMATPRLVGRPNALSDGCVLTGALRPEHGLGRGAAVVFRLPRPATVLAVRFVQGRLTAADYLIDADTDGRALEWTTHVVEPTMIHAARFIGLRGPSRYGTTFPDLTEFRILCRPAAWMYGPNGDAARRRSGDGPAAKGRDDDGGPAPPFLLPTRDPRDGDGPIGGREAPGRSTFLRGVFVHEWMFGARPTSKPPIESIEGLADFDRQLAAGHTNFVWCYSHFAGGRQLLWPSKAANGASWNVLGQLAGHLRKRGIRTFVQTTTLPGRPAKRPWRTAAAAVFEELGGSGVDGISLCPDEWPHTAGQDPIDPAVLKALLKEAGVADVPPYPDNTPDYRRAMLARYHAVARGFRVMADRARARNPDVLFPSLWSIVPLTWSRTGGVLAYDILGAESGADYMATDPYIFDGSGHAWMERSIAMLVAAGRPGRGGLPILTGGTWHWTTTDRYQPICLTGGALASLFRGAGGVAFYRHNYIRANRLEADQRHVFRLIDYLDRAGVDEAARSTGLVAVLHSRASEDFQQLRAHSTAGIDQRLEGLAGYVTQKAIEEALVAASVPHEIFYLDRAADVKQACRFPVLVLPYPYALSDEAAALIRRAHADGASVVIVGRMGEADETGAPRPTPALKALIGAPRVTFVEMASARARLAEAEADPVVTAVRACLGDRLPFRLERHGYDVTAYERRVGERRFLALINWDRRDAVVTLRLRLDPAPHRVTQLDRLGARPAAPGGRPVGLIPARDLERLRIGLPRNGYKVFEITRAAAPRPRAR